jgi:hypothetical protein
VCRWNECEPKKLMSEKLLALLRKKSAYHCYI